METVPEGGKILSVSELTEEVRTLIQAQIPECWVRGEVSNLRRQSSGHVYFSLKDSGAQLSCVLFRGDAKRQGVQLRDGMQVLVWGRLDVYAPRGGYQCIVRHVLEDGVGRLQQAFEALKRKLHEEGLFDPDGKIALPVLPEVVGIITSPTGAALRDFVSILRRRGWKGRLIVFPARVQGAEASGEIVAQIEQAEKMGLIDLLVLARGGGSLEDLWAFNEEPVVRAVAACRIPTLSGIGHEIDTTLTDFAADLRAETPSGAAEHISSQFIRVSESVEGLAESLNQTLGWEMERVKGRVEGLTQRLRSCAPDRRVEFLNLRVDELGGRLRARLTEVMGEARARELEVRHALQTLTPEQRVQEAFKDVGRFSARLALSARVALRAQKERLEGLQRRLENVSYQRALQRGFSVMRDEEGAIVMRARGLKAGDWLEHEFSDGKVTSQVWDKKGKKRSKPPTRDTESEQAELF